MTYPVLLSTSQLRDHLRLPTILEGSPPVAIEEADLQMKLDAATVLVCDYLVADQSTPDADWVAEIESWGSGSPVSVTPSLVLLAVLEQAAELYRFRGDDVLPEDRAHERDSITPAVGNLLTKYRRPSFA